MKTTLDYYNEHADLFIQGTVDVEFHEIQDKFISYLSKNATILDFGCGSGRDTKYFLDKGFLTEAMDGSKKLCEYASTYTGIHVKNMLFEELNEHEKYDGIWACSSILHLNKKELLNVFPLMIQALKKNGIIYTSFKYGDYEGMVNGRYFTYFTENSFSLFLKNIEGLTIKEQWISADVRPNRGDEKWLNLILEKTV